MFSVDVTQNTSVEVRAFFRDKFTLAGKTGLVSSQIAVSYQPTGSGFSSVAPTSFTERGNGWYSIVLPSSVTAVLGLVPLHIAANDIAGAPGALPCDEIILNVQSPGGAIRNGTAQGAGTGNNQIQLDAGASASDGFYARDLIIITGGTGVGQARYIAHYVGATKMASVNKNWSTTPDNTSQFQIYASSNSLLTEGLAQAGASDTITLATNASATDNTYQGEWLHITSGTGVGQARQIASYVGSTKVATLDRAWQTNPDSTSVYQILTGAHSQIPGGVVRPWSQEDNMVYVSGKKVSSRMRVFPSATVLAAAVPGHADGADGEIERFTSAITYNGDGTVASFTWSKVL